MALWFPTSSPVRSTVILAMILASVTLPAASKPSKSSRAPENRNQENCPKWPIIWDFIWMFK